MGRVLKLVKKGGDGVRLARRLSQAKEALDTTIEGIQAIAGCSNGMVSKVLHGKVLPRRGMLVGFCDALQVDFDEAWQLREIDAADRQAERALRELNRAKRLVALHKGSKEAKGGKKPALKER